MAGHIAANHKLRRTMKWGCDLQTALKLVTSNLFPAERLRLLKVSRPSQTERLAWGWGGNGSGGLWCLNT